MFVVLAGVMVHAGAMALVHQRTGRIDGYAFESLDCTEFHQLARNLVEHGAFSQAEEPPFAPDTWRTPGYPIFVAMLMLVVGDSPVAIIVAQQILAVFSGWLLYRLASRWMTPRWSLLAAVLFLIEPYGAMYSLWLLSSTFFLTVVLLSWHAWQKVVELRTLTWAAVLGLLIGLAVLTRPVAALVPPLLLMGLLVQQVMAGRGRRADEGARRRRWGIPVIFAASCLLVVGGWMLRTYRVAGHFTLSHQGGIVLAYFKATEVSLWRAGRTRERYVETSLSEDRRHQPHTVWESIDQRLRRRFAALPDDVRGTLRWSNLAQGNRTGIDSFALSRALGAIGWEELSKAPISTLTCGLVRSGSLLTFPLNLAALPPDGIAPTRLKWLATGLAYLALLLAVLFRLARRGLRFDEVYFPLVCTAALLVATTPQLDPRFRVPMVPLLLVVAMIPLPRRSTTPSAVDVESPTESS